MRFYDFKPKFAYLILRVKFSDLNPLLKLTKPVKKQDKDFRVRYTHIFI